MQVFMVTGLFAGQHNTELHGTITGEIGFKLLKGAKHIGPIHIVTLCITLHT